MFGAVRISKRQGSLRAGRGGRVLPPNGRSSSAPEPPRKSTDDLDRVGRRPSNASPNHEGGPHEAARRRGTGGFTRFSGMARSPPVYCGGPCGSK